MSVFGQFGGGGALLAGGMLCKGTERLLSQEWMASVGRDAESLRASLDEAMQAKIGPHRQKGANTRNPDQAMTAWCRLTLEDLALNVAQCQAGLQDLPASTVDEAGKLLEVMRDAGVHPRTVDAPLNALLNTLAGHPTVTDHTETLARASARASASGWSRTLGIGGSAREKCPQLARKLGRATRTCRNGICALSDLRPNPSTEAMALPTGARPVRERPELRTTGHRTG